MPAVPIVYNCFSKSINKPFIVVIVKKPGDFALYRANSVKAPCDSSEMNPHKESDIYDDPVRGGRLSSHRPI